MIDTIAAYPFDKMGRAESIIPLYFFTLSIASHAFTLYRASVAGAQVPKVSGLETVCTLASRLRHTILP